MMRQRYGDDTHGVAPICYRSFEEFDLARRPWIAVAGLATAIAGCGDGHAAPDGAADASPDQSVDLAAPGCSAGVADGGGAGAQGNLGIAPSSADYGDVVVGQVSESKLFRVRNAWGTPIPRLTILLDGRHFLYSLERACHAPLAPGASCGIEVVFAPITSGPKVESLFVEGGCGSVVGLLFGNGLPPTTP